MILGTDLVFIMFQECLRRVNLANFQFLEFPFDVENISKYRKIKTAFTLGVFQSSDTNFECLKLHRQLKLFDRSLKAAITLKI